MVEFKDPFDTSANPDLCDNSTCPPCENTPSLDDCFVCGYPDGAYESCKSSSTPCTDGAVECLDCESAFSSDIKFLGGYVSGFNSRIGFGASESVLNVDIVVPQSGCPPQNNSANNGACCLSDGSCSSVFADQQSCENAGGIWHSGGSCDDDPCGCEPRCYDQSAVYSEYEGKLGYIYTFSMGAFCFRGILTNHTYNEDNSGYRYRVTLTDGRSILSNIPVLLYNSYIQIPNNFVGSAISVGEYEPSVINNTCGNGYQCLDFMKVGLNDTKGIKLKKIFENINQSCISIPISNAGLTINLDKLILIVSEESRTTNTESSLLELITQGCEDSGYDFIIHINNDNEFEITPINYKRPATEKSLFTFVEDLSQKDIIISKDYGEEMATGSQKNKRILIGDNICYLTSVIDFDFQRNCNYIDPGLNPVDKCQIFNQPSTIGSYDQIEITPTPLPPC